MTAKNRPPSRFVDRPEIAEVFVDHVEHFSFSDNVLKMTFSSTQWPTPKEGKVPPGKRYPVSRLVLTANSTVELYNQLTNIMSVFEQQGLITRTEDGPKTIN